MDCEIRSVPLKIYRNIAFPGLSITFKDSNDNPIDLSGWGIESLARPEIESPNFIDLLPIIITPASGLASLAVFTPDQTAKLPLGDYNYDVVLINLSSARVGPYLKGPVRVIDANSRGK